MSLLDRPMYLALLLSLSLGCSSGAPGGGAGGGEGGGSAGGSGGSAAGGSGGGAAGGGGGGSAGGLAGGSGGGSGGGGGAGGSGGGAGGGSGGGSAGGAGFGGAVTLLLTPSSSHAPITDAINGAQASVHMVMYHLTDSSVISALVNARSRGLEVQVILDQSSLSSSGYLAGYNTLIAGGVDAIKSSTSFSITHEKSMLIDGAQLFITSMNMTDTYTDTRDYGLVLTDPSIIAEWESVFEADITNAKNGTGTTPALPVPALLWSPVNSHSGLAALIASANSTVIATVESIDSSTEVFSALEAAAQRGVNVRLLTPECVENPNPLLDYNSLNTLVSHGASVRVMPNPSTAAAPYMHGKMMVVDSSAAFVGSENFTINSLEDARECGLIVTDAQTISTLGTTFAADWSASIAIPNPLPTNCPAD